MNRCSIVVPVHNQAALTRRCLAALRDVPAEVIVVDDGSTEPIESTIRHPVNTGFAAACNDGADRARGEYVIFLNNDTIPQPGWLEALVRYADAHPAAAVVGAKLVYPDRTIQHAGVVIGQDRTPRHIYQGFPFDHPAVNRSRRFQAVTAACMLVRRELFGGFDDAFRNGLEDVDFCFRLGQRGHEIHYCHESVVVHLESVSPGRFAHSAANLALYRQRWADRIEPDDLRYYVEDGLLTLTYEGHYPLRISVSPALALLDDADRQQQTEQLLERRARELQELTRENVRLRLDLQEAAPTAKELQYQELRGRLRELVRQTVPPAATVLVVSKGDNALLRLDDRRAGHFPQTEQGAYLGYHPADSAEAIARLETLRARGAEYLLLPETSLWWLDHYAAFRRHLEDRYRLAARWEQTGILFDVRGDGTSTTGPFFLNSLPKAGTHLLTKVVGLVAGLRDSGVALLPKNAKRVLAAADPGPVVPVGVDDPLRVDREEILHGLQRVGPGSFASGHVPYSPAMVALLEEHGMRSVLILRDPRDVAVSHARFIPESPNTRLHRYYLLLSPAERLMASLVGFDDPATGCRCRSIRERMESMLPWSAWSGNHTVRFERLVGPQGGGTRADQLDEIRGISAHLGVATTPARVEWIADQAFGGTATFRKGEIGSWREQFTDAHKRAAKELLGRLLIELGYERDQDW